MYLINNLHQHLIFLINLIFEKSKLYHYSNSKNAFHIKKVDCLDYLEYIVHFLSLNMKFFENIDQKLQSNTNTQ
jgi:hypothetical protein